MDALVKTAFLRFLGLVLWASLSAWVFVIIEYTEESDLEEKYQLLRSLYENMASKFNLSIEEFNNFSSVAYEALSEPKPQWSFDVAASFVFQAITTIGYGHITPQTTNGQMLCILVAFMGIPLTLLALNSVGELIAKLVSKGVEKFERKILKRLEPTRKQTKSAVILFLFMVVLILASSVITIYFRNWRLLEGVYFWFVTFSTIGFGDYVLAKSQRIRQLPVNISVFHEDIKDERFRPSRKVTSAFIGILFTFYYILGLCIVSSVLNSVMAAIEEHKCRPQCPGCISRKTQNQEENEQNGAIEQCVPDITYLNMHDNYGFQKVESASSISLTDLK